MVLLVLDQSDGGQTGVVTMAAECCEASHVTFMARQARGLVSLALTEARCEQLNLPPMADPAWYRYGYFSCRQSTYGSRCCGARCQTV
jgi:3,4-dihydroxy 2-butanone 4-phosphate synthase/GTP cyclohydrolase II